MTDFTYYHQDRQPIGLRRYRKGQPIGEKWEPTQHAWVPFCAPRSACEITGDRVIDQRVAESLFPGSTKL